VIALALAAGIAAGLALVLPNHLEWRSNSPYLDSMRAMTDFREGSGRGRLVQYQNTLRMAADHPAIGVGPGNWAVDYPKYTFRGDPAFDPDDFIPTNPWPSSDWVALLAERGPLALVAVLILGAALAVGPGAAGAGTLRRLKVSRLWLLCSRFSCSPASAPLMPSCCSPLRRCSSAPSSAP
jgi:O-antigen ligase